MRGKTGWAAAPVLFLAALIAGCSSSTDSGVAAAILVALSGDAQQGGAGLALSQPLLVKVTDAAGGPVSGAQVNWVVVSGGGSLSAAAGLSDATGRARTTWTLGPSLGAQVTEARVGALAPAVFNATATPPNPCLITTPYALGTSVDGALVTFDCPAADGSYIDYYGFRVGTTESRRFTLVSDSFDTFLIINDASGNPLALDNDGTGTTNSALRILLGAGRYQVAANSLESLSLGPYTLSSASAPVEVANCEDVWATDGVSVAETIAATDCLDSSGPYYTDGLLVWLEVRQSITVAQHSDDFDALVGLFDLFTGDVVATDDDSGPGRDALMTYTAAHSGEFVILATTFLPEKTGNYTLSIQAPLSDVSRAPKGTGYSAASLLGMIRTREQVRQSESRTDAIRAAVAGAGVSMASARVGK
jgi:hypothetical protein